MQIESFESLSKSTISQLSRFHMSVSLFFIIIEVEMVVVEPVDPTSSLCGPTASNIFGSEIRIESVGPRMDHVGPQSHRAEEICETPL